MFIPYLFELNLLFTNIVNRLVLVLAKMLIKSKLL